MAKLLKKCDCADGAKTDRGKERKWDKCPHSWKVRYRTSGGRQGRQREQSFNPDEKQKAKDYALKIEHDKRAHLDAFVDPKAGSITFRKYSDKWLTQIDVSYRTRKTYRSYLTKHIYPEIGDAPISSLKRERLKDLLWGLDLSGTTVKHIHQTLSGVFSEAVKDKRISESPVRGMRLPDVDVHEIWVPETYQVEALYKVMPDYLKVLIPLMAGCGLRISEALAVNQGPGVLALQIHTG
ncbi:hypothetical protein AB0I72_04160 [Nocardiopsis sp. NPDC049922]|uniref:phage integrase central domain-containing protein n=1 Tax=Nocardiopsis sp. NPDC049922 TaxID=3155157 RepID=UPI0033C9A30B